MSRVLRLLPIFAYAALTPFQTQAALLAKPDKTSGQKAEPASNQNPSAETPSQLILDQIEQKHREGFQFYTAGQYTKAELLFESVLALRREHLGTSHPDTLVAMRNYSAVIAQLGRAKEAVAFLEVNQNTYKATLGERHPQAISNLAAYGTALRMAGRIADAEPIQARALQLSREVLGEKHPDTLGSMNSYAYVLRSLGRPAEAKLLFEQVMVLRYETLGEKYPATLISIVNFAGSLLDQGFLKEAEKLYAVAHKLSSEVRGKKHPETTRILNAYAVTLARQGRKKEAEPLHYQAFTLRKEMLGTSHPDTLISMANYAGAARDIGLVSEAEELYAIALRLTRHVRGDRHPSIRVLEGNLANTRLMLPARSHRAIGPAQSIAKKIRAKVKATGNNAADEAEFDRKTNKRANHFRLFLDAAWARGPGLTKEALEAGAKPLDRRVNQLLREDAFEALQDAQGSSASKAVAQTAARKAAASVSADLEKLVIKRRELGEQWSTTDLALIKTLGDTDDAASKERTILRAQLTELEAEIKAIDDRLRAEAPEYFALVRPESLDLQTTQALLGNEDVALVIVPSEYGTHVMAISDSGLNWFRSDWNIGKVNAAVKRLLWDVGANVDVGADDVAAWGDEGDGAYPFDRGTAHELYKELISPVADSLAGKRHIFIAASGSLTSLPFGLLVTNPPVGMDGSPDALRQTPWFADTHALVQVPSLQSLAYLRRFRGSTDQQNSSNSFIGFGDPVLEGEAVTRGGNASRRRGGNNSIKVEKAFNGEETRSGRGLIDYGTINALARLPGTATEIRELGDAFQVNKDALFLGPRATETNFRSINLSNTRILALATHGLMAGEVEGNNEPGLVFTPPINPSDKDDGLLTSSEIAELDLNADWVILSACNTAAGNGSSGSPGLSGIAKSFFYAGARNLLASHWPVRDDVAAKITTRTVEIGQDNPNLSRAESFQLAMREIRNDKSADSESDTWAHPNAWAPFTLIGDR